LRSTSCMGRFRRRFEAAETTLPSSRGSILPTRGRTVLAIPTARSNLVGLVVERASAVGTGIGAGGGSDFEA
jgi:hypothetical protein